MYIRWLGEYGKFEGMKSFDFEFHRKTESCAEYIDEKYSYRHAKLGAVSRFNVRIGLLCDPKKVVRTFNTDAWSELKEEKLVRGKNGVTNKGYFDSPWIRYQEAWVKPNAFTGIIIRIHWCGEYYSTNLQQGFNNLPGSLQKLIKAAAKRHNVPVYMLRDYENKLREVKIM